MLKSRLKLGELLLKEGLISDSQLQQALTTQKGTGKRLGDALVELGFITEKKIVETLGKQLGIPYMSIEMGTLLNPAADQGLEKLVPEDFAREHVLVPTSKSLKSLTVVFSDPLDFVSIDNLMKMTGCQINPVIATRSDILATIDKFYGEKNLLKSAIESSFKGAEEPLAKKKEDLNLNNVVKEAHDAPIVKLVDLLIMEAIKRKASDIHIEPFKGKVSIRYRIDGILYDTPPPAWQAYLPIISRIKILSNMDIAEKRLPQDGGFSVQAGDKSIDFRVSTIPTIYGEKAVLRILDKSSIMMELEQLGFEKEQLRDFADAISKPYGLVFITGPTGSGKTTTLYAALHKIRSPKLNIFTIEDPVEYHLDGINQVQVNADIGLTFAAGLRSFLRQDPDIMMVGEVRDKETAEICVRSALTGHLVLSTLHTNDSAEAITRLIDIGLEPFLLTSTLNLIVAQRLVRKLCPKCKESYSPADDIAKELKLTTKNIYRPKGCDACHTTGYSGRVAIYEMLVISEDIKRLIHESVQPSQIREAAQKHGMKTLRESAVEKLILGVTSIEEVIRVTLGAE